MPERQLSSHADIELACYQYFRRMASTMRGKVAEPAEDSSRSREARIDGYRVMIANHIDVLEQDAWSAMTLQSDWLGKVQRQAQRPAIIVDRSAEEIGTAEFVIDPDISTPGRAVDADSPF